MLKNVVHYQLLIRESEKFFHSTVPRYFHHPILRYADRFNDKVSIFLGNCLESVVHEVKILP